MSVTDSLLEQLAIRIEKEARTTQEAAAIVRSGKTNSKTTKKAASE